MPYPLPAGRREAEPPWWHRHAKVALELLDGAQDWGQLPSSINVEILVDQLWGD